jgi:hypothetical protein
VLSQIGACIVQNVSTITAYVTGTVSSERVLDRGRIPRIRNCYWETALGNTDVLKLELHYQSNAVVEMVSMYVRFEVFTAVTMKNGVF